MKMIFKIERWQQPNQPNPAMLRQIMANENYRVYQWCDQPEKLYGWRKYAEDRSHWIVFGALEFSFQQGESYILEAGDRDFLPAETYHSVRVVGKEPVLYLVGEKPPKPPEPPKKKRARKKKNVE